jgi:hypothetical protein
MGVTGLAALIKATKGSLATGLKDKQVEVDCMSLFFGLLKTKSYYGFLKDVKASTRHQGERSMSEDGPSKRPRLECGVCILPLVSREILLEAVVHPTNHYCMT